VYFIPPLLRIVKASAVSCLSAGTSCEPCIHKGKAPDKLDTVSSCAQRNGLGALWILYYVDTIYISLPITTMTNLILSIR